MYTSVQTGSLEILLNITNNNNNNFNTTTNLLERKKIVKQIFRKLIINEKEIQIQIAELLNHLINNEENKEKILKTIGLLTLETVIFELIGLMYHKKSKDVRILVTKFLLNLTKYNGNEISASRSLLSIPRTFSQLCTIFFSLYKIKTSTKSDRKITEKCQKRKPKKIGEQIEISEREERKELILIIFQNLTYDIENAKFVSKEKKFLLFLLDLIFSDQSKLNEKIKSLNVLINLSSVNENQNVIIQVKENLISLLFSLLADSKNNNNNINNNNNNINNNNNNNTLDNNKNNLNINKENENEDDGDHLIYSLLLVLRNFAFLPENQLKFRDYDHSFDILTHLLDHISFDIKRQSLSIISLLSSNIDLHFTLIDQENLILSLIDLLKEMNSYPDLIIDSLIILRNLSINSVKFQSKIDQFGGELISLLFNRLFNRMKEEIDEIRLHSSAILSNLSSILENHSFIFSYLKNESNEKLDKNDAIKLSFCSSFIDMLIDRLFDVRLFILISIRNLFHSPDHQILVQQTKLFDHLFLLIKQENNNINNNFDLLIQLSATLINISQYFEYHSLFSFNFVDLLIELLKISNEEVKLNVLSLIVNLIQTNQIKDHISSSQNAFNVIKSLFTDQSDDVRSIASEIFLFFSPL